MPKISNIPSKIFVKFLVSKGCLLDRVEGDHNIYTKEGIIRPVVVPIRKALPIFIILNNLKTLGISKKDFISFINK